VRSRPKWFYAQSAVVPYRLVGGALQVLLITSRRGKRWTVPKGVVEPTMTPADSAAKEAFEEAGIRGELAKKPLGAFEYEKWGGTCLVEVYALHVREVLDEWPESDRRRRRWLDLATAMDEVGWVELRSILRALADRIGDSPSVDG